MIDRTPVLVVLAGLPGVGKSSITRALVARTGAIYLRIDSIEHALAQSSRRIDPPEDAGYAVAYAIAADNLRAGAMVVADSVNPLNLTRDAWVRVGRNRDARVVEVEVICSDEAEHRRRVASREADLPGLTLPDWDAVNARAYEAWPRKRLVLDTAELSIAEAVERILAQLERNGDARSLV
jgi:predicted kinase